MKSSNTLTATTLAMLSLISVCHAYSGDGTYHDYTGAQASQTACNIFPSESQMRRGLYPVAINQALFAENSACKINPNNCHLCGKIISITNKENGKTAKALVCDTNGKPERGDLDLDTRTWAALDGNTAAGHIPVTWSFSGGNGGGGNDGGDGEADSGGAERNRDENTNDSEDGDSGGPSKRQRKRTKTETDNEDTGSDNSKSKDKNTGGDGGSGIGLQDGYRCRDGILQQFANDEWQTLGPFPECQ